MPLTAISVSTTAQFGEGLADVGFEAVDQPNGMSLANPNGNALALVANGSGGDVIVTPKMASTSRTGATTPTKTQTIGPGDTGLVGPFDPGLYGSAVEINFDVGASITIAGIQPA